MLLLFVSTLPVVIIILFFYYKDKFEKEPIKIMLLAFLGGILSIIPTLIYGLISTVLKLEIAESAILMSFNEAFFAAAIPEELSKFLFLYLFIWKNKYFNEYYDGILYAALVSLGFAWVENMLYVFNGGIGVGIMRGILSVPGHALFGVLMGYYFSHAKFDKENRAKYLLLGIIYAIIAHGTYDFLLMYMSRVSAYSEVLTGFLAIIFIIFVIRLWIVGLRKTKKHAQEYIKVHSVIEE
jgi:RsiW-degrading membrane proteinase PrsW (M82 family)